MRETIYPVGTWCRHRYLLTIQQDEDRHRLVGDDLGEAEGWLEVGETEGLVLGDTEGDVDGAVDGAKVGEPVGLDVGIGLGNLDRLNGVTFQLVVGKNSVEREYTKITYCQKYYLKIILQKIVSKIFKFCVVDVFLY